MLCYLVIMLTSRLVWNYSYILFIQDKFSSAHTPIYVLYCIVLFVILTRIYIKVVLKNEVIL